MIKNRKDSCYVYWVRLKGVHTDIKTEGYVGFTSQTVEKRWKDHLKLLNLKSKKKHYKLQRSLTKYGVDSVEVVTVCEGSKDYCLYMENLLRPTKRIGWNLREGGMTTGVPFIHDDEFRRRASEKSKAQMSDPLARKRHSDFMKSLDWSLWKSPSSDKSLWLHAEEIYRLHQRFPEWGYCKLGTIVGVGRDSLDAMCKAFKNGWIPSEDSEFQVFKRNFETDFAVFDSVAIEKRVYESFYRKMPWEQQKRNANLDIWRNADLFYNTFTSNDGIGTFKLAKIHNVSETSVTGILSRFRKGWNPLSCPYWAEFKENNKGTI